MAMAMLALIASRLIYIQGMKEANQQAVELPFSKGT